MGHNVVHLLPVPHVALQGRVLGSDYAPQKVLRTVRSDLVWYQTFG